MYLTANESPLPCDAVLIDCDDTLVLTFQLYLEVGAVECDLMGIDFSQVDPRSIVGRPIITVLRELAKRFDQTIDVDRWYKRFRKRLYGPMLDMARMRPGADRLLDLLQDRRVPHAIVTNAPCDHMEQLARVFPRLMDIQWVPRDDPRLGKGMNKPHRRHYELGAESLGVSPQRCVAIDDAVHGVQSAVDAGCYVFGAPHEYSTALDLHLAHALLPDLRAFRFDHIPTLPFVP